MGPLRRLQRAPTQRPPQRFVTHATVPHPPQTVYDWHARPGAFERLTSPWEPMQSIARSGTIREGDTSRLRVHIGPMSIDWTAVHHELPRGQHPNGTLGFVDEQQEGPFASWRHEHRFVPEAGGTRLEDDVAYRLPLPAVTEPVGKNDVQRRLHNVFAYRQARLRIDLALHARHPELPRLDVHLCGDDPALDALAAFFSTGGHRVFHDGGIPWYDDPATATNDDDVVMVGFQQVEAAHEIMVRHRNGRETILSLPCLIGGNHRPATLPTAFWRHRIRQRVERAGAFVHMDDLAATLLQMLSDASGPHSLGVWMEIQDDGTGTPSRDLQRLGLRPTHADPETALRFTLGTDPSIYSAINVPL